MNSFRQREREPREETVSNIETMTAIDSVSDSVSDTVSDTDTSPEHNTPITPDETFTPDMLAPYVYTPQTESGDSLLWNIYIMLYGCEKYETIENKYTESNRFKFELIEFLRTCKPILKANKIKINELEETLVHKQFINLEIARAISVCKGLSVCFVQGRKYYEIASGSGSGSGSSFILEKIKGTYVMYLCSEHLKTSYMKYIRENYWLMENISAPIRPISAYKLQDLIDISTRLGLPIVNIIPGKFGSMGSEKRKTKPELYDAIKLKVYL
jgi:hypothetical protein